MSGKLSIQIIHHRRVGKNGATKELWRSSYKNLNNASKHGQEMLIMYGQPGDVIEYIDRSRGDKRVAAHVVHTGGKLDFEYDRQVVQIKELSPTMLLKIELPKKTKKEKAQPAQVVPVVAQSSSVH